MKKNNDWIDIITLKVEKKPSMMIGEEAISKPESAIKVFKTLIGNRDQEVFSLLSLNIKGQINHYSEVHVWPLPLCRKDFFISRILRNKKLKVALELF